MPKDEEAAAELAEPYIYHFPDGNASIAGCWSGNSFRLRCLGGTMDDIVLALARYEALDRPRNAVASAS
jgi:spermidine dehydrogenase